MRNTRLLLIGWLCVVGLLGIGRLRFRLYPDAPVARFSIRTRYSGASAETVDREISLPLIEALHKLDGMDELHSTSSHGESAIFLRLQPGVDPEAFQSALFHQLQSIRATLPPGVNSPRFSYGGEDPLPVYILAFPEHEEQAAQDFAKEAERLSETARVSYPLGRRGPIRLEFDELAAAESRIDESWVGAELADALFSFQIAPSAERESRRFSGRGVYMPALLDAEESDPRELLSPVLRTGLIENAQDPSIQWIQRINGKPAHLVTVYADQRAEIIGLCRSLE
ncbi:MAG TPA: efflux RND transporter permease subunit, partial [Sediminispirochaeta sp.]|nr:efflux RND transporter permease subunit [Sediminispirochaeta sp.]